VLLEREPKPVIGRVLGKLSEEMDWDAMARFVQQRSERADRLHAIVDVVASPAAQAADSEPPAVRARSLLGRAPSSDSVVRRYRQEPAPLVRDSVRGYRTGRLDRVLAGDFDLF
jgi:hypothetical protein